MGLVPDKFWNVLNGKAISSGNIGGLISVSTKQGTITSVHCGTRIIGGEQVGLFRTDGSIWYAISFSQPQQKITKRTIQTKQVRQKVNTLQDVFDQYPFKIIAVSSDSITYQGGNMIKMVLPELDTGSVQMDLEDQKLFIAIINRGFKDALNNEFNYKAFITSLKVDGNEDDGYIQFIDSITKEDFTALSLPIKTYKEIREPLISLSNFESFFNLNKNEGTKVIFNGKELVEIEYTFLHTEPNYIKKLFNHENVGDYVEKNLSDIPNTTTIGTKPQVFPYNILGLFTLINGSDGDSLVIQQHYEIYKVHTDGTVLTLWAEGFGDGSNRVLDYPGPVIHLTYPYGYHVYVNTSGLLPAPPPDPPFPWDVRVVYEEYTQSFRSKYITEFNFGGVEISNPTGIIDSRGSIYEIINRGYPNNNLAEDIFIVANIQDWVSPTTTGNYYRQSQEGGIIERHYFFGDNAESGQKDYHVSLGGGITLSEKSPILNTQKIKTTRDHTTTVSETTIGIGQGVSGLVEEGRIYSTLEISAYLRILQGVMVLQLIMYSRVVREDIQNVFSVEDFIFFPDYKPFEMWSFVGRNYGLERIMTHSMVVKCKNQSLFIEEYFPVVSEGTRTTFYTPVEYNLYGTTAMWTIPLVTDFGYDVQVIGNPHTPSLLHDVMKAFNSDDVIQLEEIVDYSLQIDYDAKVTGNTFAQIGQSTTTTAIYNLTGTAKYKLNSNELSLVDSLYCKVSLKSGVLPERNDPPTTVTFKVEEDKFRVGFDLTGEYSVDFAGEDTQGVDYSLEFSDPTIATVSLPNTWNSLIGLPVIYSTKTKSYRGTISSFTRKTKPFVVYLSDKPQVRDKGTANERYPYMVTPRRYTYPDEIEYAIDTVTILFESVSSSPCANHDYLFTPDNCNASVCLDPDYFLNRMSTDGMNLYRENRLTNPRLVFTQSRLAKEDSGYLPTREQDWFVDIFYLDETTNRFIFYKTLTNPISGSIPPTKTLFLADISYYAEPINPASPLP